MKVFLEWVRNRFTKVDLMHLVGIDDENLQLLMFENGPNRDKFIKVMMYKLCLDIDPESTHSDTIDLEYIFVSFGLLDEMDAQNFLKGNMPEELHTATWQKIIESLIPNTTVPTQILSYEEQMNKIYENSKYFQSAEKCMYLPSELVSKLKVETVSNENNESVDDIADQLIEIINKPIKPNENNDIKTPSNCEEQPLDFGFEYMDIKKEVDQCLEILNNKNVTPLMKEGSIKMTPQEFLESPVVQNLTFSDDLESKIESIFNLIKAEQDLQIVIDSLIVQPMLDG